MAEMSVIWLRVAAGLYSLGLLTPFLRWSAAASTCSAWRWGPSPWVGLSTSFPSSKKALSTTAAPLPTSYETLSMCAFLIVVLYLLVHWRYQMEASACSSFGWSS